MPLTANKLILRRSLSELATITSDYPITQSLVAIAEAFLAYDTEPTNANLALLAYHYRTAARVAEDVLDRDL